ncbi:MAG: putative pre6S rRNA nuclease [Thermomicrobiales bacterium]|jgi:putative Holliday junction resolvase|nr:putative pre6S rRNA nuclease [Thermomicrobiales bacterium]MEA2527656.1 putative pre6S rRNA nuclease [Thermomicrobiales bacterium]
MDSDRPAPTSNPAPRRTFDRVLGLDVGSRRIGVAISDELGAIASPVGFVERGPRDRADFRQLLQRFGATRLVAGLPAGLSGREGPQAADTRTYADALAADLDLPLEYWDERLTTAIAERSLIASGTRRDKRRERVDSVAAAIMLQGYLDAQKNRRRRTESNR